MATDVISPTRTTRILATMRVIAWIAFIALMVETGLFLVTYVISCYSPDIMSRMYRGKELYDLMAFDFRHYSATAILRIAYTALKTWIAYLTVSALSDVTLANPFTSPVARLLERISITLLIAGCVAIVNNAHDQWLIENMGVRSWEMAIDGFLVTAGLVFIIAKIFRRGVELQTEHDLTI